MKRYCLAISLMWISVFAWNAAAFIRDGIHWSILNPTFSSLILAPFFSAALTCLVFHHRSPDKSPRGLSSVLLGLFAGTLSLISATFAIAFLDRFAPDWSIVAACTSLCTFLVLRFTPRRLPGTCDKCHYDIRASLSAGRCPECGLAF